MFLAGVRPLEAGWKRWCVKTVLAGLEEVNVCLETIAGRIELSVKLKEEVGSGELRVGAPRGTSCEISAPKG